MGDIVGSVVGGLTGSGTPNAPTATNWQTPNLNNVANTWYNQFQQNTANNPYTQYAPQFLANFNSQYNNPYASGAQAGANAAGQAYTGQGQQNINSANQLNAASMGMLPGAQQVMQMGLDPQNALYGRTAQQLQDQVRVGQAARGTTASPYGAGVENQAMSNFNIDWQNNALNRALAGLTGGGQAIERAGAGATQAGQLGAAGAGQLGQGGAAPYNMAMGIGGNNYNALQQLMAGLTGQQSYNINNMNSAMPYLQLGANQSNALNAQQAANYQNQLQQSQMQGLGMGNLFNTGMDFLGGMGQGFNAAQGGMGFGDIASQMIPFLAGA